MRHLLRYLGLITAFLLTACQGKPDTLEDTGKPAPLDLPPIEINLPPKEARLLNQRDLIKEELFGEWKIVSLDEWTDGNHIWFTNETTKFRFNCNEMSLSGKLSNDGYWHAPSERFGTTEMGCGAHLEQDMALLSLMIGPSKIERIGEGPNTLRFYSGDHEMVIERAWPGEDKGGLSKEKIMGKWDVLRFDGYAPSSRLNGEGRRSAYVDFYDSTLEPSALGTGLHIGCNFSGNVIHLNRVGQSYELVHIPRDLDGLTTEIGCPKDIQNRDEAFFLTMYQSPKIERLGEHRLRLWTKNHELILEKSETGQARNRVKEFDALEGNWLIGSVNKNGFGFGGPFHTPAVFVISKSKIQYGDTTPYLKSPKFAEGGKITGEIVGGFGARDCEKSRKLSSENPNMSNIDVPCLVLDMLINEPIAEPISLPNSFQISSGEYRITLFRYGTNRFVTPKAGLLKATNLKSSSLKKAGQCVPVIGTPEDGIGLYDKSGDVFNLNITYKLGYIGCDHEGPQTQFCRIDEGGFVTWMEDGQRRHIKASDGYVDVVFKNKEGVRCQ